MRATKRLLEVIEVIAVDRLCVGAGRADDDLNEILKGIRELRRRGDTLVRSDDLVIVLAGDGLPGFVSDREHEARRRLEDAIGGR
jgi:hypothetical protein